MKKVTSPPRTSRPTVEPRSEMWKYASSPFTGVPIARARGAGWGDLVTMTGIVGSPG